MPLRNRHGTGSEPGLNRLVKVQADVFALGVLPQREAEAFIGNVRNCRVDCPIPGTQTLAFRRRTR